MKRIALLAVMAALAAPAHAQTTDTAPAAQTIPQSDALNALEDALWADVRDGDAAYDRLANAYDGKADPATTCADIQTAHAAYNDAYYQFQGVLDAIDADTVLPDDAKPGEKDAVDNLWADIEYTLWDLEELGTTYNCPPAM